MTARLALASLLALSATASAQAPGEWTPAPVEPVAPAPRVSRWSVGVSFHETNLSSNESSAETMFAGGLLAVRYRGAWRHLELELTFGGGRERLDDGSEGPLAMMTGTFAARYRFNPERSWNWWVLAGLGGTTIARHDAPDHEIETAQRPHGVLGVGLEKRWNRFALQFEIRGLSIGQTDEEMELADQGAMVPTGLGGGQLSIGASYYF